MKEKPILLPYGTLIGAVSVVVLTFGAGSCSIAEEEQEEDDSRIQLTVSGNRPFWHPSFPDSVLTTNNSLIDSKGLAGLELEVLDHSFVQWCRAHADRGLGRELPRGGHMAALVRHPNRSAG